MKTAISWIGIENTFKLFFAVQNTQ